MAAGSCLCGQCSVSWNGEAQTKALCHCADCRKISGSMYSTNLLVRAEALSLVGGHPKQYHHPTDAGNVFTSYFCGDCGSTLWRESSGVPGVKFLKEGILETASGARPAVEVYVGNRAEWQVEVAGAEQKQKQ